MTRLILAILLLATPALAADITGIPRIMDGDTVEIENTKIRLSGIDAPETHPLQFCLDPAGEKWDCGVTARDELVEHAGGKSWTFVISVALIDMGEALQPVRSMARTSTAGWCRAAGHYRSSDIPTPMMPTSAPRGMLKPVSGLAPS